MALDLSKKIKQREEKYKVKYPDDPTKKAFVQILEFITNTFYKNEYNTDVTVRLSKKSSGDNYYDGDHIVLSEALVDAYGDLNLPRFLVYYHELGHHLFTTGKERMKEAWFKLRAPNPLAWHKKYHHLDNWIEDYYIEDMLLKEHDYLTDVLTCLKQLPPDYDITRIEHAFSYWYQHQAPTPALGWHDQVTFKGFITRLLTLRASGITRFGKGILTPLAIKKSRETKYVELLIEFYAWCVDKKIFPKDKVLPPLSNPNNHLTIPEQSAHGTPLQEGKIPPNLKNIKAQNPKNVGPNGSGDGSTTSKHSGKVGKKIGLYEEAYPIKSPTTIFKKEIVEEMKQIERQMLDMSQRLQVDESTYDGLFSTQYENSAIIQSKVIIQNFFNPYRILDQVLFKKKKHTYMNVAIYRDISSSTRRMGRHDLMHYVCEQLYKDIPVNIKYYLYASGTISILEMPYVGWMDWNTKPIAYRSNNSFQQLGGGTNSNAIADVITQQMSEKWLNIIITDGDLSSLMKRHNIKGLLKNVFVISVNHGVEKGLLGVEVNSRLDIPKIQPVLSTINLQHNT